MTHTPLVSLHDIYLCKGRKTILQDISLEIFPQEIVSIVGFNGAGKSSLLKIIAGIYKPTKGTVHKTTKAISYIPQNLHFDRTQVITVKDFVFLYNPWASFAQWKILAKRLWILHLADSLLGELSGGELQKTLIVQWLMSNPDILILDEPTASIDTTGTDEFYAFLAQLREERKLTILLVSHDMHRVFSESTRVVCLHNHVCCVGKPSHISNHETFSRIFGKYLAPYHHQHDHCKHHQY